MASLLWGGDAGAAESERLNRHVTANEPGRARGRGLEQHSQRKMCRGGEGGAPLAFWSGLSNGRGEMWQGFGRGPRERRP